MGVEVVERQRRAQGEIREGLWPGPRRTTTQFLPESPTNSDEFLPKSPTNSDELLPKSPTNSHRTSAHSADLSRATFCNCYPRR